MLEQKLINNKFFSNGGRVLNITSIKNFKKIRKNISK